jgi:hypothetical protein
VLPVKRRDGAVVMVQQHTAPAVLAWRKVGKPPSSPAPILPHVPATCQGMPGGRLALANHAAATARAWAQVSRRAGALAACAPQDALGPRAPHACPPLLERRAPFLGSNRRDDCRADW